MGHTKNNKSYNSKFKIKARSKGGERQ